jgi:hypothetical protein
VDDNYKFGFGTLKLRATFVEEGQQDSVSPSDITAAHGYGAVKIPAIFIPEGADASLPGYPYVHVGQYAWGSDGEGESGDQSEHDHSGDQEGGGDAEAAHGKPRTGDSDDASSGEPGAAPMPPAPTLVQAARYVDPAKTAVATLRALKVLAPPTRRGASRNADGQGAGGAPPDAG